MSNDDIHETPSITPNFRTELAAQLAHLVPQAIADGKVDVAKLQDLLDGDAAAGTERFGLFWPGKKRALRAAQEPTPATLRPDLENSKDWDTSQNAFIEGDNLEVLKILQKHYHGKVKMIYIDPPYNTGKDFVYPDNYKEGLDTYLEWTRQVNEEGKKLSSNSESEGRYHSNWLNMMYPRLKLARNLLTDDGLIFISIDDNEVSRLRNLCDEVFGEANLAGQFVWKKGGTGKNDSQFLVVEHEYVLVYARRASASHFGLDMEAKVTTSYNLEDEKGRYSLVRLDMQNLQYSSSLDYDLVGPNGEIYRLQHKNPERPNAIWRWSRERVRKEMSALVFKDGKVYTKNYAKDGAKSRSLLVDERFGVTRTGKAEAEAALGKSGVFDFPKPVRLIQHLVRLADDKSALVLDFFAGSGTTAQAVMDQNAQDGGTRRFVVVQLPEPTPASSEARAQGFASISEISRARISGAGAKITEAGFASAVDTGFRAYKLADTNFSKWQQSSDIEPNELEQHMLELRDSSSDDDATPDDLFTEILLKQGFSLTERTAPREVAGLDMRGVLHSDDSLAVLAYLNEHVKPTLEQLRAMVAEDPAKIIVLEDAFDGDDELKTNLAQLCKTSGIELWTA
ncbi:site-specific DNA-methyltransferase [Kocuria carniphila]|uniref:site-specific DNA-methyltransferase n=1 Tax=Kocuria carniphila TaxID=262208 RepID=UPI0021A58A46|nr:site-specific DNA-methyltransferase [Kocuria carniphila]MCT1803613.1 site-specific DNA-methyltransferase [Kocuria carniphila]